MTRSLVALLWLALACGSPPTPAYVRENEQAETARHQGQHALAAAHYERAAQVADKPRDAEEARYRAAESYERAGDAARAEASYKSLAAQGAGNERGARAQLALAELLQKNGREPEAQAELVTTIRQNPDSGVARAALVEHLDYLRKTGGSPRALAYLDSLSSSLAKTELGESIAYARAQELDAAGELAAARDAYLACATSFPYPRGTFWDDALFHAAEKELALAAPARAVVHLRRMLVEQESATLTGSYERGRYAEAQLKIGEIYRDLLHDPLRARAELRKVWQYHPTSRLVDDALFQEALIAHAAGDEAGTCAPLAIITQQRPESRYVACAHLFCAKLAATQNDCHDYIKRAAGVP